MLSDYTDLVIDMNLEGVIQMIAHIKMIGTSETKRHSGRAELWHKLQTLLVKSFEVRHEDYEYSEVNEEVPLPLDKDSIMLLASILIASETTGHLRDPAVINYLFKSVFELTDYDENSYQMFGMEEIAILVDAYYKSQMVLQDKYGDLFFEILEKQELLTDFYMESQPVKQTLRLFRGFAHMSDKNLSDSNRQSLLRIVNTFIRSEKASSEIEPSMWLSVIDIAHKLGMEDLQIYA